MTNIKHLILEVILEALWGKKFDFITTEKDGSRHTYTGMATPNMKPGERPYRITWLWGSDPMGHIDLTWEEMQDSLRSGHLSPEIIQRGGEMWGPETMAKDYEIRLHSGPLSKTA